MVRKASRDGEGSKQKHDIVKCFVNPIEYNNFIRYIGHLDEMKQGDSNDYGQIKSNYTIRPKFFESQFFE